MGSLIAAHSHVFGTVKSRAFNPISHCHTHTHTRTHARTHARSYTHRARSYTHHSHTHTSRSYTHITVIHTHNTHRSLSHCKGKTSTYKSFSKCQFTDSVLFQ